ncbi:MAG: bifunctional sulfate adenylyltransferase/adenylylsulfate kinase [Planctomycetota bacterium]
MSTDKSTPARHGVPPVPSLLVPEAERAALRTAAREWPSVDLTARQMCDLELLMNGGFAPLGGFMGEADHASVCRDMRLADGTLWPIPITLDVPPDIANGLGKGGRLVLRDAEGVALAVLEVDSVFTPDLAAECRAVYGTDDAAHPGVGMRMREAGKVCVGGRVLGLEMHHHYDFAELRRTPAELRAEFAARGFTRVVGFQTRNPMHRAHVELVRRAAQSTGAAVLIHPAVGQTKPGDIDHFTRVRGYRALLPRFGGNATLSLLPLAMRMAGPREAVWHAILRRNHGCTHFLVGRDHAGPGSAPDGKPWYEPFAAQELAQKCAAEIGIEIVPSPELVYVAERDAYVGADEVRSGETVRRLSGTELRDRLLRGDEIPEWFSYEETARELRRAHPPRRQQGVAVFFTGLSGAGKSTVANVLRTRMLERGDRRVTFLDGDLVRKHLSSELGFSREHRDLNIHRIGFVAAEVVRHGGFAICAAIAPFANARAEARRLVEETGGFVLVHVATPLATCEERDRKGLYAKARAGIVKQFTGISDPYEVPADAELVIDTRDLDPGVGADRILRFLIEQGYLPEEPATTR